MFAPRTALALSKINLYLHVTGRRADGYHTLDSLAVFGPAADRLEASFLADAPAGHVSLEIGGPFGAGLVGDLADNLVLRAAAALRGIAGSAVLPPVKLVLEKNLPIASGIGGGSADAAAALRVLAELWGISADLAPIAARLGADVPVCLAQAPARMQGVGEILSPGPAMPDVFMLLANCGEAVPTPPVFKARAASGAGFSPDADLPASFGDAAGLAAWLAGTTNDLAAPAMALHPRIATVVEAIGHSPGCLLARMSGSGGTCFGLFAKGEEAHVAAVALRDAHGWWTESGPLGHAATAI